jgi:uncharacterized damage-inducible protein DinB
VDNVRDAFVELCRHNLWANLRLLDRCAVLTDDQLDASAPGTYGRLRDTLVHLLAAEERFVAELAGQSLDLLFRERDAFPGLSVLRERARRSGTQLIEAARARRSRTTHFEVEGKTVSIQAIVPMMQAINHATEHRTQVASILSQIGVQPPDLHPWAYWEERATVGGEGLP